MKKRDGKDQPRYKAYLLHITHYDPMWNRKKTQERRFSLKIALEAVEAMARSGLNTLVIDCADGVRYKSHPELKRRYTAPMNDLKRLAARAQSLGIDVVPKLNFAQSHWHCHNHWFRPHHLLFDNAEYWKRSFKLIDELIKVCRPRKFFHIGMDEDHERSSVQWARAIKTLRDGLRRRGLRVLHWTDIAYPQGRAWVHAEKCAAGEPLLPKDVIPVVWDYNRIQPKLLKRLRRRGMDCWIAPGRDPSQILKWKRALLQVGGSGMLFTQWCPCRPAFRARILGYLNRLGTLLT